MLKYQIHKLSKGTKGARSVLLEDILTSDVFGLMDYFPYEILLKPFLQQIADKNQRANFAVPNAEPIRFSFWEYIAWDKALPQLDRLGIEPDVIIEWKDLLLIVEAKFLSPTDPKELFREFLIASRLAHSEKKYLLLLVDKNLSAPSVFSEEDRKRISIQKYIEKGLRDLNLSEQFPLEVVASSLLWTNWQSFYSLIEKVLLRNKDKGINEISEIEKRVLNDMLLILERKGLVPFDVLELEDISKHSFQIDELGDIGLRMRKIYSDLSEISIDTIALGNIGLRMQSLYSDLSEMSVDINALGKIGLKVNDPIQFLSSFELEIELLSSVKKTL